MVNVLDFSKAAPKGVAIPTTTLLEIFAPAHNLNGLSAIVLGSADLLLVAQHQRVLINPYILNCLTMSVEQARDIARSIAATFSGEFKTYTVSDSTMAQYLSAHSERMIASIAHPLGQLDLVHLSNWLEKGEGACKAQSYRRVYAEERPTVIAIGSPTVMAIAEPIPLQTVVETLEASEDVFVLFVLKELQMQRIAKDQSLQVTDAMRCDLIESLAKTDRLFETSLEKLIEERMQSALGLDLIESVGEIFIPWNEAIRERIKDLAHSSEVVFKSVVTTSDIKRILIEKGLAGSDRNIQILLSDLKTLGDRHENTLTTQLVLFFSMIAFGNSFRSN